MSTAIVPANTTARSITPTTIGTQTGRPNIADIAQKAIDIIINGNLYNNNGEWLSELINGEAIINEVDIKDYPSFQIKIDDKIYVVKNK